MLRLPEKWPGLPEVLQAEDISRFLKFALFFILGLSLLGLAGVWRDSEPGWDSVLWNSLFLAISSFLALWLLERRKTILAVYIAVIGSGVTLAAAAWMGAGVMGITYAALILPILIAAIFLGQRAGFIAALASTLYGAALLAAGRAGWLINLDRPVSDTFAWLAKAATFFIAAQLIGIALWQIERALKKARSEIDERAQAESEIRRLIAELEQRIAERTAQLTANEKRYRLISTVSSDYMFSSRVNEDGSLVLDWVAGAFEKITGYSREEYVKRGGWLSALHPDSAESDRRDMQMLQNNQPVIGEARTITKSGDIRWVRIYAHPRWNDQEQKLEGVYGAVQDITDRKRAEDALRASEQRFRSLVEQLPVVTYIDDATKHGVTTYISPQFEAATGYRLDEGIGSALDFWLERVHPQDRQKSLQDYNRCFYKGEPLDREYRFLTRAGHYVWLHDQAVRLNDPQGRPEYILGVLTDVTEQKLTEERLRQQATRLTVLYRLGQSMAASHSLEEIYSAAQSAAEQLIPVEAFYIALANELQNTIEYVYLTDKGQRYPDESTPISERTLTAHVIETGELLIIRNEVEQDTLAAANSLYGTQENTLSVLLAPLKPGGKVIGVISAQHYQPGMYTEEHSQVFITLANQVATAIENARLLQSLRLQAAALDAAANAIVISNTEGVIQWVNPAFTKLTGYSAEEAIGQKTSLLRSRVQAQAFYDDLWNTLANGRVWHGELVNRRKDGSAYMEEQTITPVRNEQGRVFRYISIKQDITKRKQAEEQESRRREMMEKVIEMGKAVTKTTEPQRCFFEIHQGIQKGLGFDRVGVFLYDESTGRVKGVLGTNRAGEIEENSAFSESVYDQKGWLNVIDNPSSINLVQDYDKENLKANPEMKGVKQHVTLSAWAGEKPVALITADNLVTGREFTEEQLEALQLFAGYAGLAIENAEWNAQLERRVNERTIELVAANKELESLAYAIAHDLRIPARAMHGFASILMETEAGKLGSESLRRLNRIRDSAKLMGQQVDDLLEFMRVGRISINHQPVNMNSLVKAARARLERKMEGRDIRFVAHDLPACKGDQFLLRQVWVNLLDNAIKFTSLRPQAEIEIGGQVVNGKTEYYIRDNGAGFDMRFTGNLFGAFQRLHHPDEFEGTGMGLAIAQRIIQRHGGRIWAEARKDEGAAFYFTLE